MKLENKIKRYITKIENANNVPEKQYFLHKVRMYQNTWSNEITDWLLSNYGEATDNRREEIEKNIDLFANDYTYEFLKNINVEMPKIYIDYIIQRVVFEFKNC